jgi:hypothetical protein
MLVRCAALVVCLAALAATAAEKPDDTTTKVKVAVVIPKDVASFEGRVLELRLYEYDPRAADTEGKLVELVEEKGFKHEQGTDTKKELTISAKGKLDSTKGYYVTAFVLQDKQRTHIGQADNVKEPFNKVLTQGQPRDVTIRFKAVK